MRRLPVFIGFAVFLVGCAKSEIPSASPRSDSVSTTPVDAVPTSEQTAAADDVRLSIVDFGGIEQHIAHNRGKVVVMDAWSTSCAPCMKEFHHLVELHHAYPSEQLACMSLSFDYEGLGTPEEQQDRVLTFLRTQRATFDNLLSSEESDVLYRKLKLAAVPAVFVYDRTGKLRKRFDNERAKSKAEAFTYEQVGQLVAELVSEPTETSSEAK